MSKLILGRYTLGKWELCEVTHPVAAKEHECSICYSTIIKGERYTTARVAPLSPTHVTQGVLSRIKLCPSCRTNLDPLPEDLQSEEHEQGNYGMNLSNVASLVREDVVTIECTIPGAGQYTFKCLKELADTLERGDRVVAHVKDELKICTVVEVHDECKIDVDSNIVFKWAFQKIDSEKLRKLQKEDNFLIEKLKAHKRNNAREQVMAMFGISDSKALLEQLHDENKEDK